MIAKVKKVRDSKHYAGVANIRWKKERERQAQVLAKKIVGVMSKNGVVSCNKESETVAVEDVALQIAKALVAKKK